MVYTKQKIYGKSLVPSSTPSVSIKTGVWINCTSIVFLSIIYFLFFNKKDLLYFPNSKHSQVAFFTDAVDHGHSTLDKKAQTDTSVGLSCTLQQGFMFPYAGLELMLPKYKELDLSHFDKVQIEVSAQNIQHLSLYLVLEEPRVKDPSHRLALRRISTDLDLHHQNQVMDIDLAHFTTPNWWYSFTGLSKKDFPSPRLDKFKGIIVSTGVNPPIGTSCSFSIQQIKFYKDTSMALFSLALLQLAVLMLTGYLHFFKKKTQQNPTMAINVNYKAVETLDQKQHNGNNGFLDYIHENFTDAELNLKQISRDTGIPEKLISSTIADKFDCNLKTYINNIRIAESKRLLLESNLSISEIAYKTGFNSPANFNRVFKALTEASPSEFLQKMKS